MAAGRGFRAAAALLLERGAVIDHRTELGNTALIAAVHKGHKEVVALLLANGATVEITSRDGQSALTIAERAGRLEVLELLRARLMSQRLDDKNTSGSAVTTPPEAPVANPPEAGRWNA